jgi:hypothetical protein
MFLPNNAVQQWIQTQSAPDMKSLCMPLAVFLALTLIQDTRQEQKTAVTRFIQGFLRLHSIHLLTHQV